MNSLQNRLFLILVLITSSALALFGWLTYNRIHDFLEDNTKQKLLAVGKTVIKEIDLSQSPILTEKKWFYSALFRPGHSYKERLFFSIWDNKGELLFQSNGLKGYSIPYQPHKHKPTHFQRFKFEEETYSGLWITYISGENQVHKDHFSFVQPGTNNSITLLIVFADEEYDEYLYSLLFWLLTGGIGLSVLIGLIGRYGIRWGLRPIKSMTDQMAEIDASALSYRFDEPNAPAEMQTTIQTVNALLERLEKSFDREKQFSSDAAHELRTPLSALQCASEIALSEPCENEFHRNFLDQVHKASIDMRDIVENLLLLARMENRNAHPEFHRVNVVEIVKSAIDKTSDAIQQRSISLKWNPPNEAIYVSGSAGWLEQMFLNLLNNAIRFNRDEGNITISIQKNEKWITLKISDTGVGIPTGAQRKIFERFYRVDEARDRRSGGAGLGLSLVQSIATIHNGQVSVDSRMGEGSTFVVHLPSVDSS